MKPFKNYFLLMIAFVLIACTVSVAQTLKLPDKITLKDTNEQYNAPAFKIQAPISSPVEQPPQVEFKAPILKANQPSSPKYDQATVTESPPGTIIDQIKGVKSWDDILNLETGLYTLLITLGGYFSFLIPGLKSISNNTYRVLVWAIFVIIGVSSLGLGSIWQGALSYLFSTSLYEVILKWLVKTPKADLKAT